MHTHQHQSSESVRPASLAVHLHITRKAERELAAFLSAAAVSLDAHSVARASDLWLHTMEHLEWSGGDVEKFLRGVSVLAIAQLVENSTAGVGSARSL
jgi:hypothetical protein